MEKGLNRAFTVPRWGLIGRGNFAKLVPKWGLIRRRV